MRTAVGIAAELNEAGHHIGIAVVHVPQPSGPIEFDEIFRHRERGAEEAERIAAGASQRNLGLVCPRTTYHPLRHMFYADRLEMTLDQEVLQVVVVRGAVAT